MKSDQLKRFTTLRRSLQHEKAKLEARLKAINHALGINSESLLSSVPVAASTSGLARKRTLSAAGKANIAAGQRARWARIKRHEIPEVEFTQAPVAKRTMSEAAKARIAAAQRKRWARIRAEKAAK